MHTRSRQESWGPSVVMRSVISLLYALCALVLLATPLLQIRLHRKLSAAGQGSGRRLGGHNHLLLLLVAASGAGVYYFVNPEANIRVDLLLAIPLCALALLLWAMFLLRLARQRP